MSTYLPPPLAYQQPEEPPRFVECHGCNRTVDRDECVLVNDEYYCDSCATCGCGQPASSRCPSCDAFTCVACFLGGICTPCANAEEAPIWDPEDLPDEAYDPHDAVDIGYGEPR